jgi:hypothetical protein
MRKVLLLACVLLLSTAGTAKFIPDPIVRYRIDARLNPAEQTIKGHQVIQWRNHSDDSITDLQFHLYLNAFKNNQTSYMTDGSNRRDFPGRPQDWGYQQVHSIKVDGEDLTAKMGYIAPDDGNQFDQTVLRVPLRNPIPAMGRVTIEIDWTAKLPYAGDRTGHFNDYFFAAQWYPKPGVYEAKGERRRQQGGWNTHQHHGWTEFYADFGTFDVNLTVPKDNIIGATGVQRSRKDNGDGTVTYNFYQEDVHDFTWLTQPASQAMLLERDFKAAEQVSETEYREWSRQTRTPLEQMRLTDVKVKLFIQREHEDQIDRHFKAAFAAIKWYGLWYGAYPYEGLTVVDPPGKAGTGGMEYPTLITAGTRYIAPGKRQSPESVIVHEFGHQFWYGMVANNEFEEAWLDEGFNSYSESKTLGQAYGPDHAYVNLQRPNAERGDIGILVPGVNWVELPLPAYPWKGLHGFGVGQWWEWIPQAQYLSAVPRYAAHAQSDAMERNAWEMLEPGSYGAQAYSKPELTLFTLEALLGDDWPYIIRGYYQRYRFKHPHAQDFVDTVNELSGRDMNLFFQQTMYGTGLLNYSVSFTNNKEVKRDGYFDQGGKPVLTQEGAGEKIPPVAEVLVRRLGEMQFPITLLVRFDDGSEVVEHWDGQYRWQRFSYPGKKIVSAEIDPAHHWKLEYQRADNSALAEPSRLAADKWYLRWVVWIQNILMAFSFFS